MVWLAIIPDLMKLLAFDTGTELLHLGACDGRRSLSHVEAGGARSSARIVPLAMDTLRNLGLSLTELDAIVVGRGPGSFTGLRTACAVAQGLAYGARRPVLPIDTLWALAEESRQGQAEARVLAVLDARMGQFYTAAWHYRMGHWQAIAENALLNPDEVQLPLAWRAPGLDLPVTVAVAEAEASMGLERLLPGLRQQLGSAWRLASAAPTAAALMRLAPQAWTDGLAVPAAQALPLYVRDKVAQTTAERATMRP